MYKPRQVCLSQFYLKTKKRPTVCYYPNLTTTSINILLLCPYLFWPWSLFPHSHKSCQRCYDEFSNPSDLTLSFLSFAHKPKKLVHLNLITDLKKCLRVTSRPRPWWFHDSFLKIKGECDQRSWAFQRKQFSAIGVTTFCKRCRNNSHACLVLVNYPTDVLACLLFYKFLHSCYCSNPLYQM